MKPLDDPTPPAGDRDPLDRFAEELRSLRPRSVSDEARRYVAGRLEGPAAARRRRQVLALRLSGVAALAAAAVTVGWAVGRPGRDDRPRTPVQAVSPSADAGCECRVRFVPRPPVRSGSADAPGPGWRA